MEELGCLAVVVLAIVIAAGVAKGCSNDARTAPQAVTASVPDNDEGAAPVVQAQVVMPTKHFTFSRTVAAKRSEFATPDFSFGTVAFWILTVATFIALIACTENQLWFLGLLCLGGFLGIVQQLGKTDPLGYAKEHVADVLLGGLIYVITGILWMFVKWYLHTLSKKFEFIEFKEKWLADHGASDPAKITDKLRLKWAEQKGKPIQPLARDNKSRIVHWGVFWPASMAWSLLDDFVVQIGNVIYQHSAVALQGVSNYVWRDMKGGLD